MRGEKEQKYRSCESRDNPKLTYWHVVLICNYPSLHVTSSHYSLLDVTTHHYPLVHVTSSHYSSLDVPSHHFPLPHVTSSHGSLKFSGKLRKEDSIKIDTIPHALDIRLLRLDRGVINEGDSSRVQILNEASLVCAHRSLITCSTFDYYAVPRAIRSTARFRYYTIKESRLGSPKFCGKLRKEDSIKIDTIPQALHIRLLRLDRDVINEGDSARVQILN